MIVELDPLSVLDLADGSVVIYTPADGAAVVAVLALEGVAVAPDNAGQIGFGSDAFGRIFAETAAESVQVIFNEAIADPVRAGLTFGGKLAEPWAENTAYDGSELFSLIIGAGHYWQSTDVGTSGATEPDWASAFGSTIVDNGITWEDQGALPTVGTFTFAVQVEGTSVSVAGEAYADVDELARILKIRNATPAQLVALQRALSAAATEIDAELDLDPVDALTPPFPALVVQVNLDRAEELWQQQEATLGFVGIGAETGPARVASNTWEKHAVKLAPLKGSWGIA